METVQSNGTVETETKMEHVVVPLAALHDFDSEPSPGELRRTYQLIQELKRIRRQRDSEHLAYRKRQREQEDGDGEAIKLDPSLSASEAKRHFICTLVERYRPEMPWQDVAEKAGISRKTLLTIRKKEYPEGHKYHP